MKFDSKTAANGCIQYVKDMFTANSKVHYAVIGVSGGKDSTVDAAICAKALGPDRVIGVLMPNGKQADLQDAVDVVNYLGIKYIYYNIGDIYDLMISRAESDAGMLRLAGGKEVVTRQARENLPPRLRMAALRFIAQCYNGFVCNNCNASETFIGYTTIDGDNRGDFAPIKDFTVTEVIEIGRHLGIPERFLVKPPADGLCGKTDEEKIGIPYSVIDRYIRTGKCEDEDLRDNIIAMHNASAFKREHMSYYHYWDSARVNGTAGDILYQD